MQHTPASVHWSAPVVTHVPLVVQASQNSPKGQVVGEQLAPRLGFAAHLPVVSLQKPVQHCTCSVQLPPEATQVHSLLAHVPE